MILSTNDKALYREQGFVVVRSLFPAEIVQAMTRHYMDVRGQGPKPGDMGGSSADPNDPLNRFPRMINMHDWDEPTARWSADERLRAAVTELIDDQPVLNQTMLYFKPPGARGQGLHQDQQYITIDPLIGAWVALDPSRRENGQMVVVPGSKRAGLLPVEAADASLSFTSGQTKLPPGAEPIGVDMQPGDCLFFDGKTIHGSYPNLTSDSFRRSFICHFVGKHAREFVAEKGTLMRHLAAQAP